MSLSVDIQKQLGRFRLQVQFEADNERLALLGASGCGKSVTLRCVAGIMTPDEGKILLDGTLEDIRRGNENIDETVAELYRSYDI